MLKRTIHKILFFWRLPKKILIPLILILLALGWWFFFRTEKTPEIELIDSKKQDIRSVVSASGQLTGKEAANLKFKISGKVTFLDIKPGDVVEKGQHLATLDTQALQIALQQAQNTLIAKQATAQKIEDDVKGHDTDETFTQKSLRTAAQADSNNAYDAVKAAQVALQDAYMTSPMTGVVTQVNALVGQTVLASENVIQVVDDSEILFEAEVDESDIGKIGVGQNADITLNSTEDMVFHGTIQQIMPVTGETSTGATVVKVKISLPNPPTTFVHGLNGQAEIIVEQQKNVLTVPIESLMEDSSVYIQKNGSFEKVKVKTGIESDTDVEIKSGLSENQKVVKNPSAVKLPTNSFSPFNFFGGK